MSGPQAKPEPEATGARPNSALSGRTGNALALRSSFFGSRGLHRCFTATAATRWLVTSDGSGDRSAVAPLADQAANARHGAPETRFAQMVQADARNGQVHPMRCRLCPCDKMLA
jgi:hypothetical protein